MSLLKHASIQTNHDFEVCVIKKQMGLELAEKDLICLIQTVFHSDNSLGEANETINELKFQKTNVINKLDSLRSDYDKLRSESYLT